MRDRDRVRRRVWTWLAVAGLVAGGIWFARERRGDASSPASRLVPPSKTEAAGEDPATTVGTAPHEGEAATSGSTPSATLADERRGLESNVCRVLDAETSAPIENARIQVTELRSIRAAEELSSLDVKALDRRTVTRTTDAEGTAALDVGEGRAAMWVSRVGWRASGRILDSAPRGPQTVRLEPAPPLSISVRDETGAPAGGVEVTVRGRVDPVHAPPAGVGEDSLLLAAFHQTSRTDDQGRTRLAVPAGSLDVLAMDRAGNLARWSGEPGAELELTLAPAFRVGGSIELEGETGPATALLSVFALLGEERLPLASVLVPAPGAFEPIVVPWRESSSVLVRAEVRGRIPAEVELPLPARGGWVEADLRLKPGLILPVRVLDEEATPIAGATATVLWYANDRWQRAIGRTGSDGLASVGGVPPGPIRLRGEAEGFVETTWPESQIVTDAPEAPLEIHLRQAGVVVGSVLIEDQPASAFLVQGWNPEGTVRLSAKEERDSPGRFRIDSAPPGVFRLFATAPGLRSEEVVEVEVQPGRTSEVLLRLVAGFRARGQVLDALTGEPIAGANVRSYLVEGEAWRAPLGEERLTGPDGTFEITEASPGENHLFVRKEGYARRSTSFRCEAGGTCSIPPIRLEPLQDLVVRIETSAPQLPPGYRVDLDGSEFRPETPVGPDGIVRFEDLVPGAYWIRVIAPDLTVYDRKETLRGGAQWEVVFRVDEEAAALDVLFVPREGTEIPPKAMVLVAGSEHLYGRVQLVRWLPESHRVRFPGPLPPVVSVVLNVDDLFLAARSVRVAEVAGTVVQIPVDTTPRGVRLIRPDGTPARADWVAARPPGHSGWSKSLPMDPTGYVGLELFGGTPALLELVDAVEGPQVSIPVPSLDPGEVVELIVEGDASLEVSVRDGDPVAGLNPILFPAGEPDVLADLPATDGTGRARLPRLRSGEYDVEVYEPGYWPLRQPLSVRPGGNECVLEVRRLGSVTLEIRGAAGRPLEGARVELHSLEFDVSVSDWVAAGRVPRPPAGLVTDPDGRLTLTALPHGEYAYSIHSPTALATPKHLEGTLSVPPAAHETVQIRVP